MEITLPDLPSFKYQHGDAGTLPRGRKIAAIVLAVAAVVALFIVLPLGLILAVVALILLFVRDKKLRLAPRYLLCGNTLIYYGNVTRLQLSSAAGTLLIETANGQRFMLDRDKFPTNARKAPKIAANKAAKFAKVSGKIVEKVRSAAPNADIQGI